MSLFRRVTHYHGGGLRGGMPDYGIARLSAPHNFVAPSYIDLKPYCLPTSDQGNEPACAGYAVAGFCEVLAWKHNHVQRQYNGLEIYRVAKTLDGEPDQDGTMLEAALRAAQQIGYLPADAKFRYINNRRDIKYALHEGGVVVSGFNITSGWNRCDRRTGMIGGGGHAMGGHAVLSCWYQEAKGRIAENHGWQNSWIPWGCNGFGRMTAEQFDRQFMYGMTIV